MTRVMCGITTSVDGYVAGPDQSLANPFGDGRGDQLHRVRGGGAAPLEPLEVRGTDLITHIRYRVVH